MKKNLERRINLALLLVMINVFFNCSSEGTALKKIEKGDFTKTITETGELVAVKTSSFVMPMYGRYWYMMKIIGMLDHGSIVNKGDSIMQFEPSEIKKFIIERETQLENEKANLQKIKVQLENRSNELQSEMKIEEASFNLKKLELDQYRFESEKTQKIKQLEFKQAEIRLDKVKKRIELNKIIADNDLKIQELRLSQVQKEVRNAINVLPELTLRTPLSGIFQVANKRRLNEKIRIGDEVYFGTLLASVPDLTWMMVNSSINETDINKVKEGQQVNVRLDALPDVAFKGEVSSIGKLCHPYEKTKRKIFDVIVKILVSDQRLKPGMTVSCEYICNKMNDVLIVPNEYLFNREGRNFILIKKGSGFVTVEVAIKAQNNSNSVIEGNIKQGQLLIPVSENLKLKKD